MMRDLKYLIAYIPVIAVYIGVYVGGYWTFSGVVIAFVFIPIFEMILPISDSNYSEEEERSILKNRLFDYLLYFNVPLLFGLIYLYFDILQGGEFATYEIVGMTLSVGIICGTSGINVAHELGHRKTRYEQLMSQLLLLPELYMHFFIEHNQGHHKNLATPKDPATARYGEPLYAFFIRSVVFGYLSAWRIENQNMRRLGLQILHIKNRMIKFQIIQLIYLVSIGLVFGWQMIFYAIAIAIGGFFLLECVNYIEHYGLERKKLSSGRYEPVKAHHSWNSNHTLGRIILYELTRHADHHFKSTRKYQILEHYPSSPQLPYGYPTSILLALVPPLWFNHMNKEVHKYQTFGV